MPKAEHDAVDEVMDAYITVAQAMQKTSVSNWLKLDLTVAQLKVLFTIYLEDPVTIGKIAETLGIGQSTASHLVDRLVQAGLVERTEDPADRRYIMVRTTREGEDMIEQLRQGRKDQFRNWLLQLSDTDLSALRQGMQALARISQAASSQDTKMSLIADA